MRRVTNEIREHWPAIGLSIFLGIVWALTAAIGSDEIQQIVTEMMIRIVVVVGLYIFIGNSGLLSFGHISFMAIGAYAHAWFTCCTLPMVKQLYAPGLPVYLDRQQLSVLGGCRGRGAAVRRHRPGHWRRHYAPVGNRRLDRNFCAAVDHILGLH